MSDGSLLDRVRSVWLFTHPFHVLQEGLPELREVPDGADRGDLVARYRRIARRGEVALRFRALFLVLFYFAAIATVVGGVGGVMGEFAFLEALYRTVLALSAGFSILFWTAAAIVGRYVGVLQSRLVLLGIRIHGGQAGAADPAR